MVLQENMILNLHKGFLHPIEGYPHFAGGISVIPLPAADFIDDPLYFIRICFFDILPFLAETLAPYSGIRRECGIASEELCHRGQHQLGVRLPA